MKAVLQRVTEGSVAVDGAIAGEIGPGLVILLGVVQGDTGQHARFLAEKVARLRIFEDGAGKLNRSLLDMGGEALVISNFTLCANARKGNRPSFTASADPGTAERLYEYFSDVLKESGVAKVDKGVFGGDMQISLTNDGPVTIILDTDEIMPQ